MWKYTQADHLLFDPSGSVLDRKGYSGSGAAKNEPDRQCLKDQGPIPRGMYTIGDARDDPGGLGPVVLPLMPDAGNAMCGRSADGHAHKTGTLCPAQQAIVGLRTFVNRSVAVASARANAAPADAIARGEE